MNKNQVQHHTHDMQEEHQHLREIVREIETALAERQSRPLVVAAFLDEFSSHVLAHFEHEEADGYFAEIVVMAPRLYGHVQLLRAQHDRFREMLVAMQRLAQQKTGSDAWWSDLETHFRDFTTAFQVHEHAENSLLQEAYDRDIGAED